MKQRVVLVTGGSRGIGAETAVLAAEKGWDVVISYRNQDDKAQAVVKQIEALGQKALAVKSDVAVEAEVISLFERIDSEFGRLDALVNNAGVLETACKVTEMSVARLQRVFNVNIVGSFVCAQQAIQRMSTSGGGDGGSIVNLSSAAARLGSANEFVDYAASKGAIDTFTLGLSKEIAGDGIRVNAVRPGLIVTDIHADSGDANRPERLAGGVPMGRSGSAREVATSIVWLMSDEASYVNGALLDVAGGR
jgi:NAD(P)-dependent dehydrogenase (short-subunit alcohol dehydrogenase family)